MANPPSHRDCTVNHSTVNSIVEISEDVQSGDEKEAIARYL